jgi:glycosyltransferase domain-containing protein
MNHFPILDQLTIVIPTFCRPDLLRRNLGLLESQSSKLIILDGSPEASLGADIVCGKNVIYVHEPSSLASRIRHATTMIETDFVALLGDDDLFLPSGLSACVEHLLGNPSHVSAIGRTVRFHHRDGSIYSAIRYDFDKSYYFDQSAKPSDLLHTNYGLQYIHYGVFRTAPWISAMNVAYAVDFESPYVPETAFRMISALRQRSVVLNQLYWLRSDEGIAVEMDGEKRSFEFSEWVVDPSLQESRDILIDGICGLEWGDNVDQTDYQAAIKEFFGNFACTESSEAERRKSDFIAELTKSIGRLIPRWLRPLVRRFLPRTYRQRTAMGWSWNEMLDELGKRGIQFDYTEMKEILDILTPFAQRQSR